MSEHRPELWTCLVGSSWPQRILPVRASTRHMPFFARPGLDAVVDLQPRPAGIDLADVAVIRDGPGRWTTAAVPLWSSTAEPSTISSRPSPSTSAACIQWAPWPQYVFSALAVVPSPQLAELAAFEVVGDHLHEVVGAALDDQAGRLAVEIGDAQLVAGGVVVGHQRFAGKALAAGPIDASDRLAGQSVEDRQVLGPGLHAAVRVAGVAFAGLHGHLGLAVAVEVVDHVGRVPDALLDRPAQIVPPEELAVGAVGFELVGARGCGFQYFS